MGTWEFEIRKIGIQKIAVCLENGKLTFEKFNDLTVTDFSIHDITYTINVDKSIERAFFEYDVHVYHISYYRL